MSKFMLFYWALSAGFFFGFRAVERILADYSARTFPLYQKLSPKDKLEWASRLMSIVHALAVSFGSMHLILTDKTVLENIVSNWSFSIGLYVSIFVGYAAYDWVFAIEHHSVVPMAPSMHFHHALTLLMGVFTLANSGVYSAVGILFLLCEFSTPFLHIRWFLRKLKPQPPASSKDSPDNSGEKTPGQKEAELASYRAALAQHEKLNIANLGLFMLTYFFVRVLWLIYVNYLMFQVSTSAGRISLGIHLFARTLTVAFCGLNLYWFYMIIKVILREINTSPDKRNDAVEEAEEEGAEPPPATETKPSALGQLEATELASTKAHAA